MSGIKKLNFTTSSQHINNNYARVTYVTYYCYVISFWDLSPGQKTMPFHMQIFCVK